MYFYICMYIHVYMLVNFFVLTDLTPPQFLDCPASISRYSDRGSNKAFITRGAPTVSDNFDVIVHINLTGPGPSYFFESPVPYVIQYDAIDAAGNKALPCRFTITVSRKYSLYTILRNILPSFVWNKLWLG